jgi:nucleotide-binding universal stress UspA family protein
MMYQRIMAPLDGSDLAECTLGHLESIAKAFQPREIILVRVVVPIAWSPVTTEFGPTPSEIGAMEDREKRVSAAYLAGFKQRLIPLSIPVKVEVLYGKAAETLVGYAKDNGIDLIVMSSHGRSGISRWVMGSVADRVVRASAVPVLLVKAEGCSVDLVK